MKKVLGAMSGIIFAVFSIAILGMLMSFTWGALGKLFPNSFTNQMWGMVMFDLAAMCWALAFVFKSNSVGQYAAAGIGFIVAFLGTLLMVAAEVIMGGQTFVQNNNMGQYLVYGFVIVTAVHAGLVYLHHAMAPDIHEKINIGIARGEITTEAIRQATDSLEVQKAMLAQSIHGNIVDQVKRDLNIPIAVQPGVGFVPANSQQYAPVTIPQPVTVETGGTYKKPSWVDRMKQTFNQAKQPQPAPVGTVMHEQTVVQQVELQPQPKAEDGSQPPPLFPAREHDNRTASPMDKQSGWDPDPDLLQDMHGRGQGMVDPGTVSPYLERSGPAGETAADPGQPEARSQPTIVKPRKVYTWNCAYCGEAFETTHYGKRYCNETHKKYAYRERKKQ